MGDDDLFVGQKFATHKLFQDAVNTYSKKNNFTLVWKNELTSSKRNPRARGLCSRFGKPRREQPAKKKEAESAASAKVRASRKKTSKKGGCLWQISASAHSVADEWTVTALHAQHTGLCKPSKAQYHVMRLKRGIPVSQLVFDDLCKVLVGMKPSPSTSQIRSWIQRYAVGMRTDAMSIANLKARILLYEVLAHLLCYINLW